MNYATKLPRVNSGIKDRKIQGIFRTFAVRMEDEKQSKTKYYLYIDECGDQNLENFNPNFPVFTLCGVLVSRANKRKLEKNLTH